MEIRVENLFKSGFERTIVPESQTLLGYITELEDTLRRCSKGRLDLKLDYKAMIEEGSNADEELIIYVNLLERMISSKGYKLK